MAITAHATANMLLIRAFIALKLKFQIFTVLWIFFFFFVKVHSPF